MKAKNIVRLVLCTFFLFAYTNVQGQRLLKRVKKKVEDKVVRVVDEELNGKEKKENDESDSNEVSVLGRKSSIDRNFINSGTAIFYDDFNSERTTEFPSKWTPVKGAVQNNHVLIGKENEGVIEWISNYATLKPSIENDSYLGDSFKVEIQVFFNLEGGNQFYNLNFKNLNITHGNYDFRIANSLVKANSDNVSRMPGQPPRGWHTIQISFNKGNLKAFFDGVQLVNNPDIGKYEFTHLELYASSPGSSREGRTKSMVNHFSIGKEGLPLYDRLMTTGRIVVNDIYFDVNESVIKPNSYPALEKIAQLFKSHPDTEVSIEGHTDATGSNESNMILSENRAAAIKNYLTSKGIKRYRLSSKGYGEEKPISTGNSEESYAMNRRVEFVLHR